MTKLNPTPLNPPLHNLKSKWPAIILAESRTASVKGRITSLIVSMRTMNGISALGVPVGTRAAKVFKGELIHPNKIKLNQSVKANLKDTLRWALDVNT